MHSSALFLDRDGVIHVDHGYVHRPDQFEFVPGIFPLARFWADEPTASSSVTSPASAALRDELLNETLFRSLAHTRALLEALPGRECGNTDSPAAIR